MKKVAILTNIPRPYRIGFFNELSKFLKERNVELKVFFYSSLSEYPERKENIKEEDFRFDFSYLKYGFLKFKGRKIFFIKNLEKILRENGIDIVIVGNMSLVAYQVSTINIKKILWSGSFNEWGLFRVFFRKKLLKKFDAIISYSTICKGYFKELGFPSEKIFVATNSVDTSFFQIEDFSKKDFSYLKILFCGKLNKRKGAHIIPEIIKKINCEFQFNIVGDGEYYEILKGEIVKRRLEDKVFLRGFLQPEKLRDIYHESNLFLFPTFRDPWGLVVNEAMAGGMAILSSIYAGVTYDLIFEDLNGYRINPGDIEDILRKINFLGSNLHILKEFGSNSLRIVKKESGFHKMCEGFWEAISSI